MTPAALLLFAATLDAYLGTTPKLDGIISPGEYADATEIRGVEGWISQFSPVREPSDLALRGWVKHDGRRLYFDHGTVGVDNSVAEHQRRLDAVLKAKGFVEGKDFQTICHLGTEHHLSAWRARLGAPLLFLFGNQNS